MAQSERGNQFWRQKLSANERKAAAILDSANLVYESPGQVSAKASITGRGCGRTVLLTEDSVTLDTTGNIQHWKEVLMEH